jgi:hypothetical protein
MLECCGREVIMVHAPVPNAVQCEGIERLGSPHQAADQFFGWSPGKIRRAAFVLLAAAAPAVIGFWAPFPFIKWLCLAWLAGVALLMQGLSRRACADMVVLSVDHTGILDHRLMSKHIPWQEIAAIWPVKTDRSYVIDVELRWPKVTLGEARWRVRMGAYCQIAYGVPAVTVSMVLLDGNVSDLLKAVAQYRPDLLHCTNREALC